MTSVDCKWSIWEKDGVCSATCGLGIQKLKRIKIRKEENGGMCDNRFSMKEPCDQVPCPGKLTFKTIQLYFVFYY
jgi:hypothetical protein